MTDSSPFGHNLDQAVLQTAIEAEIVDWPDAILDTPEGVLEVPNFDNEPGEEAYAASLRRASDQAVALLGDQE